MISNKNLIPKLADFALPLATRKLYVSPYGNDNNDGSIDNEYKTIQEALDNATAGTDIIVYPGTYFEKISVYESGDQTNGYVRVRALISGTVIIDGSRDETSKPMLTTWDMSYIVFENIVFQNSYGDNANGLGGGATIDNSGTNIALINCTFKNMGIFTSKSIPITSEHNFPIITFRGDDEANGLKNILVHNCTITNTRPGYSECISFSGNVENIAVTKNYVYDNENIGIDFIGNTKEFTDPTKDKARNAYVADNVVYNNKSKVATSAGIYVDGGKDILIQNNLCKNNGYGIEVGSETLGDASNVTVINNIMINNDLAGLLVGGSISDVNAQVDGFVAEHNVLFGNDTKGKSFGQISITRLSNARIKNNHISVRKGGILASLEYTQNQLVFDENILKLEDNIDSVKIMVGGIPKIGYYEVPALGTNNIFSEKYNEDIPSNLEFHKNTGIQAF